MPEQHYEQLVHFLEGMIADGVKLIHGGQVFDWEDTQIPDLLKEIKAKREVNGNEPLPPGTLLKNIHSGQKAGVINEAKGVVTMAMLDEIITFPKNSLWEHYEKSPVGE
jgi:hypothetical protein